MQAQSIDISNMGKIGRALTELITTGAYQSIDISNMAVERVLGKEARPEPYVL